MATQEFIRNFLNKAEEYCANLNVAALTKLPKDFHEIADRVKITISRLESLPIENLTDPAIAELTIDLVDWKIITDPQKINLTQDLMTRLIKTGNLFISKACILIPYLLFEEFGGEIDFQSKKSFNKKMNSIVEELEEKKEQTKIHLSNLEGETSNEVNSFKNQIRTLHGELKNKAENFIKETNKKRETLSLVLAEAVTDNEKLRKNLDEFKQYAESQKEGVNKTVQATRDAAEKQLQLNFQKILKDNHKKITKPQQFG